MQSGTLADQPALTGIPSSPTRTVGCPWKANPRNRTPSRGQPARLGAAESQPAQSEVHGRPTRAIGGPSGRNPTWAPDCTGHVRDSRSFDRLSRIFDKIRMGKQVNRASISDFFQMGPRLYGPSPDGPPIVRAEPRWAPDCTGRAQMGLRLRGPSPDGAPIARAEPRWPAP